MIYTRSEIFTDAEQKISIQPGVSEGEIELYFSEGDGTHEVGPLYMNKECVEVLYTKLCEHLKTK